jgi:transposase
VFVAFPVGWRLVRAPCGPAGHRLLVLGDGGHERPAAAVEGVAAAVRRGDQFVEAGLIYRMMIYRRRKNERKGFTETDYARLLDAAHQQLGGPIVLIWDNINTHVDALMRSLIDTRPWLTVFSLPTYAPELNPVETVWSHLKRGLGNLAPCTLDDLAAVIRSRLKQMQYRPDLLDAFLAHTGLITNPRST